MICNVFPSTLQNFVDDTTKLDSSTSTFFSQPKSYHVECYWKQVSRVE